MDPVTNLNLSVSIVSNERTSARTTWTPPYTLMNVPILLYIAEVDVGSISLTWNITNTSTSFDFQANPENFNDIRVAVIPLNKAGRGKIAATSTMLSVTIAATGLPQKNSQGIFETTQL